MYLLRISKLRVLFAQSFKSLQESLQGSESFTVFLGFVNILVTFQLVMKDEFDIALVNRSSSQFIDKERWIKAMVRQ